MTSPPLFSRSLRRQTTATASLSPPPTTRRPPTSRSSIGGSRRTSCTSASTSARRTTRSPSHGWRTSRPAASGSWPSSTSSGVPGSRTCSRPARAGSGALPGALRRRGRLNLARPGWRRPTASKQPPEPDRPDPDLPQDPDPRRATPAKARSRGIAREARPPDDPWESTRPAPITSRPRITRRAVVENLPERFQERMMDSNPRRLHGNALGAADPSQRSTLWRCSRPGRRATTSARATSVAAATAATGQSQDGRPPSPSV